MFLSSILITLNIALVKSELVTLDDDNWGQILQGEWMVEL